MQYNIKAIPTTYEGVNFRSRNEAKWAAFFDLCSWCWEYEPFDLEGWAPDFIIKTPYCDVLIEIKYIDLDEAEYDTGTVFRKAQAYWRKHQVMLLGGGPTLRRQGIGRLMDTPDGSTHDWNDVYGYFTILDAEDKWREAGNLTQWIPPEERQITVAEMIENGLLTVKEQRAAA